MYFEHNAEGAKPFHNISTVDKCAMMCEKSSSCVAFDYDRNTPPYKNSSCWIHDDQNLKIKEQPAVDHYTKDMCENDGGTSLCNFISA